MRVSTASCIFKMKISRVKFLLLTTYLAQEHKTKKVVNMSYTTPRGGLIPGVRASIDAWATPDLPGPHWLIMHFLDYTTYNGKLSLN